MFPGPYEELSAQDMFAFVQGGYMEAARRFPLPPAVNFVDKSADEEPDSPTAPQCSKPMTWWGVPLRILIMAGAAVVFVAFVGLGYPFAPEIEVFAPSFNSHEALEPQTLPIPAPTQEETRPYQRKKKD